ncbi:CBS domain-containing protein [Umezawaea sp. Da 62-37]|uniref:CBS domain-containing protein n=1 Tax=Umezawaea sp. Da 62-37 TaxID=3075927 RepID=UPI0028F6EE76|nr:CBS domain-containing protein [Umezawaea sp. Da 62-37]WNV84764.1 CBS domain-containing protein [Umezawaea sp. Da 62-37]
MRVHDIMSSPAVTVTPDVSIREAAGLLASHGFTALPVVDSELHMVGIVTETDLLRGEYADTPESLDSPVERVMTSPAFGMGVGSSIALVARVMLDDHVRCVPIVDGSTVVGVVTRRDVVRALARTDTSIAADVRRRLEIYGGVLDWSVSVRDGVVSIGAEFVDPESEQVVVALAGGVVGVADVRILTGKAVS